LTKVFIYSCSFEGSPFRLTVPQNVYPEAAGEEEGAKIDTDRLSGKGTLKTNNFAKALGFEACR
jgi:hypothetical protein